MADNQELSAKAQELVAEIQAAGNKVRELKAAKADITEALATLQAAKAAYKKETGQDYGAKPKKKKGGNGGGGGGAGGDDEFELFDKIIAATNAVNKLQIEQADTAAAEAELAALKEQYKAMAGKDFEMSDGKKKKKKKKGGGGQTQPQGPGKKGKKPKKEKPKWGQPGAKAAKKAAAAAAKAKVSVCVCGRGGCRCVCACGVCAHTNRCHTRHAHRVRVFRPPPAFALRYRTRTVPPPTHRFHDREHHSHA